MAKGQATTYEILEREKMIIKAIAQGIPRIDIEQKYSSEWGITVRQVQNYYYKVLKKIKKQNVKHQNTLFAKIQTQYEQLYAKSYKENDRLTCRLILTDMAKLFCGAEEEDKDVKKIIVKPPKLD
jgi:hypothetical protein